MTSSLQTFRATLSALSPVFIGGGEHAALSAYTDFIQQGKQIIVLDQKKFQSALAKSPELIEEFVQGIKCNFENNRSEFSLAAFILDRMKISINDLEHSRLAIDGDAGKNTIRRFIASSGRAFIPGSSIKGAFRTAVLVDWLVKHPSGKRELAAIRSLVEKKDWRELKRANPSQSCFGSISRDVFKYFRVSDSGMIDTAHLHVSEIKRVSIKQTTKYPSSNKTDIPLWSEALRQGAETTFSLSLQKPVSKTGFPFLDQQSVSDLLYIAKGQSKEIGERELNELDHAPRNFDGIRRFYEQLLAKIDSCNKHEAIVRLGGGKTWFDSSIGLAVDQDDFGPEALFGGYLELLKIGHLPFPSTRSAVMSNGNPILPLGWVKITINQESK